MNKQPWSLVPELKKEHLLDLAKLIISTRADVMERHEPEIGDTKLSLCLRAYECCRTKIIEKAIQGDWPWLNVITPTGRFTAAINGIPVRFSRNRPEHLPERKLIASTEAFLQMQLFSEQSIYAELRWFIVIDTPYDLAVQNIYMVGYNEKNEIICQWEIPLENTVPVLGLVEGVETEVVNVPPAKPKLKSVEKRKKQDGS